MKRSNFVFLVMAALLLLLTFSAPPIAAQEGEFQLTVLHTNDVHARIDQFDSGGNS